MPNNSYCCAHGCPNKGGQNGIKMFSIPNGKKEFDQQRRKLWLDRIGKPDFELNRSSRLCEAHFEKDQFEKNRPDKLKPNAVPTIFLFSQVRCRKELKKKGCGAKFQVMDEINSTSEEEAGPDGNSEIDEDEELGVKQELGIKQELGVEQQVNTKLGSNAEETQSFPKFVLRKPPASKYTASLPKYWSNLMENLRKFRETSFLCDTVLTSKNRQFYAHSVVLAAISPVFQMVFQADSTLGLRDVKLPEIEDVTLEVILHFAYTGRLTMPREFENGQRFSEISAALKEFGLDLEDAVPEFTSDRLDIGSIHIISDFPLDDPGSRQPAPDQDSNGSDFFEVDNSVDSINDSYVQHQLKSSSLDDTSDLAELASSILAKIPAEISPEQAELMGEVGVQKSVTDHSYNKRLKNRKNLPKTAPWNFLSSINNQRNEEVLIRKKVAKQFVQNRETSPVEFECTTCRKEFKNRAGLQNHKKSYEHKFRAEGNQGEMGKDAKEFRRPRSRSMMTVCDLCGMSLRQGSLKGHMESQHEKMYKYKCEHCKKAFQTQHRRLIHIRRMHYDPEKPECDFLCDICGKNFLNIISLQSHKYAHKTVFRRRLKMKDGDVNPLSPHVCEICNKRFSTKGYLAQHVAAHSGVKSHACRFCDKRFVLKATLLQHIIHHPEHGKTKKWCCPDCGKRFIYKFMLLNHQVAHRSDKPFACHLCSKKFKSKMSLGFHLKGHEGVKPHRCHLCGYSFSKLFNLQRHMLHHANERKFPCDRCEMAFKDKYGLREHCYRTHDNPLGIKTEINIK